uniref:Integrator complex subunit 10 n=1 Tax=Cacopsylla melanoneura TaxID=428564 RepID=A0A8D8W9X6_9HEMI
MPPMIYNPVTTVDNMSTEQYLIHQAKLALKQGDAYASKSWMITARTMFPDNFSVQFEVYEIEKTAGNIEECARCLSALFLTFPSERILWNEINMIIVALRSDSLSPELQFYNDMFLNISEGIQKQIIMKTAERTKDPMEHCRLLLLVIGKFPQTMSQVTPTLIDTLLMSEKTYFPDTVVNSYREMMVYDVMPIIILHRLELSSKLVLSLVQKSAEFVLHATFRKDYNPAPPHLGLDRKIRNPWSLLFEIHSTLTSAVGWTFKLNIRDPPHLVWQSIQQYSSCNSGDKVKQLVYGCTIYLCYIVYVYTTIMEPGRGLGEGHQHTVTTNKTSPPLILVEGFVELTPPDDDPPPSKRPRRSTDPTEPLLTVPSDDRHSLIEMFGVGVKVWSLMKSNLQIEKEFTLLSESIRLGSWVGNFSLDVALYTEDMEEVHSRLKGGEKGTLTSLMMASTYHCLRNKNMCIESVFNVVKSLEQFSPGGNLADNLTMTLQSPASTPPSGRLRHLHFLPLARLPVLQYCTRLLFNALKEAILHITSLVNLDMLMGHLMVLSQLDWPQERPLITSLCARIRDKGSFSYDLFSLYIVEIDILEEFMHMATRSEGAIRFELSKPTNQQLLSQRRVTTRNVDKGAKEDLKATIKRQVARSDEPIDELIVKFLTTEQVQLVL